MFQLIPLLFIQTIYAAVIFLMARKQAVRTWVWTLSALVPFLGLFVALVFFVRTILSMLDRLNALERNTAFS
ncbi:hypothetical protein [Phenylobacterium sp.]|uniref:hypothetical protein n=1 Tax=Phenylobacterium sp. TaxID=1871053 RepID=UPI002ED8CE92